MSKLISGKEALMALANGQDVESKHRVIDTAWGNAKCLLLVESFLDPDTLLDFRLKPRTITINGIELPAPFEPKEGDWLYFIAADREFGYSSRKLHANTPKHLTLLGAWRTEGEIKQVVDALRCVFGGES